MIGQASLFDRAVQVGDRVSEPHYEAVGCTGTVIGVLPGGAVRVRYTNHLLWGTFAMTYGSAKALRVLDGGELPVRQSGSPAGGHDTTPPPGVVAPPPSIHLPAAGVPVWNEADAPAAGLFVTAPERRPGHATEAGLSSESASTHSEGRRSNARRGEPGGGVAHGPATTSQTTNADRAATRSAS